MGLVTAAPQPTQRTTLDNGLILLHRENPSSLTLAVGCFLRVSALMETTDTAGWRNVVQQALLDLPDAQGRRLEQRMAEQAIQLRLQASPDYTEALFLGTADQLPQLMSFVREALSDAQPELSSLTARRQQAVRELQARQESAETVAAEKALEYLFRGSPCAWPPVGTFFVHSIRPERLQMLRRLHHAPNNAIVTVSGPVTWQECREQAMRRLGDLLPRPGLPTPAMKPVAGKLSTPLYVPWEGDNAVILTASTSPAPDHPDFAAAAVLAAVLGSGEGSRLFMALRDTRGLTYSVHTELAPSRLCGMIQVMASCEPNQAAEVFRIMRAEVAALQSRPPTAAEVHRAVAYLTANYLLGHQRNAEIVHYLGMFEALLPGQGDKTDLAAMFDRITVTQVEAATRWLHDRNVWVQVGGKRP